MADRRMFAKSIVLSDAFLDMPMSARCLYFTLSMMADDDGFVGNPKSIMRQCGASQDDMLALIQKRYVLAFDSGVIVIKHWKINNYLRNDRHKDTTYLEELSTLMIDEKGAYTEINKPNNDFGIPTDNQCVTQYRLGKDSIGKDSIEENSKEKKNVSKDTLKEKFGEYQNVKLTLPEYDKLANDYGIDIRDKAISFLDAYIEEKGYKSKSHNLAIRRWVIDAVKKSNASKPQKNRDLFSELNDCI